MDGPRKETQVDTPTSFYGMSKREGEKYVKAFGNPYVILRPPIIYGGKDSGFSKIAEWVNRGLMVNAGAENGKFSFIYVEDLVRAIIDAIENDKFNDQTFYVCEKKDYPWKEFINMIGFKEAGLITASPSTLVKLGAINTAPVLCAVAGLIVMATLNARRAKGAVLIGILASALCAWAAGLTHFSGLISAPPSLEPTLFKLDLAGLATPDSIAVILIFLFMSLFDTLGTLVGVGVQAGLMKNGKMENISRAMRRIFVQRVG